MGLLKQFMTINAVTLKQCRLEPQPINILNALSQPNHLAKCLGIKASKLPSFPLYWHINMQTLDVY